MSDAPTKEQDAGIDQTYELDAPPQKVWRAISLPQFREQWLPGTDLADPQAETVTPGAEVRYRMRDSAPPFLESTVTFRIAANADGGTSLRVIHRLVDARLAGRSQAANSNGMPVMRAA